MKELYRFVQECAKVHSTKMHHVKPATKVNNSVFSSNLDILRFLFEQKKADLNCELWCYCRSHRFSNHWLDESHS